MPRRHRDTAPTISLFSFQDIMAAVTGIMIMVTLLLALEPLGDKIFQQSRQRTKAASAAASAEVVEPSMSVEAAEELVRQLQSTLERRLAEPAVTPESVAQLERESAALERLSADTRERRDRIVASRQRAEGALAAARRMEEGARRALASTEDEWVQVQMRSRVRFLPGERFPKAPLFIEVGGAECSVGELAVNGTVALLGRSERCDFNSIMPLLGERGADAFQIVFVVRQDGLASFDRVRSEFHEHGWDVGWQLWDSNEGAFFDAPKIAEEKVRAPESTPSKAAPR